MSRLFLASRARRALGQPASRPRRAARFLPASEPLEGRALLSTLEVNPGDPDAYQTIQTAVDAAPAGATIQVAPGTYHESVTIPKTKDHLTIIGGQVDSDGQGDHGQGDHGQGDHGQEDHGQEDHGQGGPSVVEPTGLYGFDIQANDVTVENFTVQAINNNTNSVGFNLAGSASGDQVLNNVIRNNTFGIYLNSNGQDMTVIAGNQILNNNNDPVNPTPTNLYSASGNGIYSDQGASNVLIRDNHFSGQTNASILFAGGPGTQSNLTITHNVMTKDSAIILANTTQAEVSNNTNVGSNGYGVLLPGGDSFVTVKNNTLRDGAYSGVDVDVYRTYYNLAPVATNHDLSISSNTITGFAFDGTTVAGGSYNVTVNNNTTSNNGRDGITLTGGVSKVSVKNNTTSNNGLDGILVTADVNGPPVSDSSISNNEANNNKNDGIALVQGAHDDTVNNNTANNNGRDGIHLGSSASKNDISNNTANKNHNDGIYAASSTHDNTFRHNSMHGNVTWDAQDESKGNGTAGTANFWVDNSCDKANPPGICNDHGHGHGNGGGDNNDNEGGGNND